jgi:hypothetical protein
MLRFSGTMCDGYYIFPVELAHRFFFLFFAAVRPGY